MIFMRTCLNHYRKGPKYQNMQYVGVLYESSVNQGICFWVSLY